MASHDELLAPLGIVGSAFADGLTQDQRDAAWEQALTEDVVWEAPFTEPVIRISGRLAVGKFFDWLIANVPAFSTEVEAVHFVEGGEAYVIQVSGGGKTAAGGEYGQKYFSMLTVRDGKISYFLEHFKAAESYRAFGRDRFHDAIDAICAGEPADA